MKTPKLTQWFEIGTHGNPKRVGWYDVRFHGCSSEQRNRFYWTGKRWQYAPISDATVWGNDRKRFPKDAWRGMMVKHDVR